MLGTRGQWGSSSHNTAPTASMTTPRRGHAFEKRNRPKCYEPLQRLCRAAPRSCRRSRAEAVERGPGQWRNTEQRPLERPACRALRRKPATNIRFWHFRTCGCRGNDVRSRRQNGPCLCLLLTSENGPKAVIGRSTVLRMPISGSRLGTLPLKSPEPMLSSEKLQQLSRRPRTSFQKQKLAL